MTLHVVGLNHRRAPVELRERLAFRRDELATATAHWRKQARAAEAVVLSTCNRTELYAADPREEVFPSAVQFLARSRDVDPATFAELLYYKQGEQAVDHLFRVAAGLDSMVFGETQILGQVREAYEVGRAEGLTGRTTNRVFQRAIHAARRIHTETSISRGGVSVPSVAAGLAQRIFEDLSRRSLLVIGAGEMAELTAEAFRHRGVKRILVANRSPQRAAALAHRFAGEPFPLDSLQALLPHADILVSCAESEGPVVGAAAVECALRARRGEPILLIDLGVPRNIDPQAGAGEHVYLFDIDDLQEQVSRNLLVRQADLDRCAAILAEEVRTVLTVPDAPEFHALAERLTRLADRIAAEEAARLAGPVPAEEIRRIVRRAVYEALHHPARETDPAALDQEVAESVRNLMAGLE